jgi:hypothetical protein
MATKNDESLLAVGASTQGLTGYPVNLSNVTEFKSLGTTLTNENNINDKMKSRLNLGNDSYHSIQNLLSSCLK